MDMAGYDPGAMPGEPVRENKGTAKPHHIVGLGASAGGLEALEKFFH